MGWFAELLLESPIPPAVWMPDAVERRSRGRAIVDAIVRGRPRHKGWHRGHSLHDLGGVFAGFGFKRYISGDEVEEEITSVLTHLNPPIAQGWTYALIVALAWIALLVLRAAGLPDAGALPRALLDLAIALVGCGGVVFAYGWFQREIEVCEHGIVVRRWTDVWLRRQGFVVGLPHDIRARIHAARIELDGPGTADVAFSTTFWPPSARAGLGGDLSALGLRVDKGDDPILPDPEGPTFEPSHHHHRSR
jgi:hypothetical protein